jgi:DNA topoisomerase-1
MDKITLAEAFELFKLPRKLGFLPEGDEITTSVGRFGPYVKYGAKYVSLKDGDDPYTVTLERALEVIRAKQEADANRIIHDFADIGVQVLNGRYGPYITDGEKNARVPKDRDPKTLTAEECQALIAAAPARPARFGKGRFAKGGKNSKDKAVGKKGGKASAKAAVDTTATAASTAAVTAKPVKAPKDAAKAAPKKKKSAKKKSAAAKPAAAKKARSVPADA